MIRSEHSVSNSHSAVASVHIVSLCLLLALSVALAPSLHATAIATASIQVTNFTIIPAFTSAQRPQRPNHDFD